MRYYKKEDQHFVENGTSVLRVGLIETIQEFNEPNRVVKVLAVIEVKKQSEMNPIRTGDAIALSFPESHANAKDYVWEKGERCQVPLKVQLK